MGKVGTGILYLFTGGLFGIGTIYDAITMAEQVDTVNRDRRYSRFLEDDEPGTVYRRVVYEAVRPGPGASNLGEEFRRREYSPVSPEQTMFKLAQKNGGSVSPAQLALDANISVDSAKDQLEDMVTRGYAELRVRKTGALAYVFPEFLTPEVAAQFESLT